MLTEIPVKTSSRIQFVDITQEVFRAVDNAGINSGVVTVFVPHTTAGVTINENADPSVKSDISAHLSKLVPANAGYSHMEGNSDSHIKSSLVGPSLTLIVENGRVMLGTWQGILFCEFDGPRRRKAYIKVISG